MASVLVLADSDARDSTAAWPLSPETCHGAAARRPCASRARLTLAVGPRCSWPSGFGRALSSL